MTGLKYFSHPAFNTCVTSHTNHALVLHSGERQQTMC